MLIKSQIHFHTNWDPYDSLFINYSPFTAIDKAVEYWYKVLSFTHHNKLIYSNELRRYAFARWIILIPWVEYSILWKHILIYNADEELYKVKSFVQLRDYKEHRKNLFIVAPHPFYPAKNCLRKYLIQYNDIFDAVEYSILYLKKFGFRPNLMAKSFSIYYNKPLIWTADVHDLKYLNDTYSIVDVDFDPYNLDIKKIDLYIKHFFESIKTNKISIVSKPLTLKRLASHSYFFVKWFLKRWFSKTFKRKIN